MLADCLHQMELFGENGGGILISPNDLDEKQLARMVPKKGNYEGYFRTPNELHITRNLVVCLKDPFTDETSCSDYENPYNYYMTAYYSCAKPGR